MQHDSIRKISFVSFFRREFYLSNPVLLHILLLVHAPPAVALSPPHSLRTCSGKKWNWVKVKVQTVQSKHTHTHMCTQKHTHRLNVELALSQMVCIPLCLHLQLIYQICSFEWESAAEEFSLCSFVCLFCVALCTHCKHMTWNILLAQTISSCSSPINQELKSSPRKIDSEHQEFRLKVDDKSWERGLLYLKSHKRTTLKNVRIYYHCHPVTLCKCYISEGFHKLCESSVMSCLINCQNHRSVTQIGHHLHLKNKPTPGVNVFLMHVISVLPHGVCLSCSLSLFLRNQTLSLLLTVVDFPGVEMKVQVCSLCVQPGDRWAGAKTGDKLHNKPCGTIVTQNISASVCDLFPHMYSVKTTVS